MSKLPLNKIEELIRESDIEYDWPYRNVESAEEVVSRCAAAVGTLRAVALLMLNELRELESTT